VKRKPRVYHINEETSVAPSLEDIVLDYLQSIDSPWEEIPEDSPFEGNPWLDLENPNEETLNQNLPIHNMANVLPPGGNQPLLPPLGGNQPPPPPPGGNQPPPPLGALPPWIS